MTRPFLKPIEPKDLPPLEQEAIAVFAGAGWGEDAEWLGTLALSVFKVEDEVAGDQILGEATKHNLEVVARARRDGRDREQSLLIAFSRLCGCEEKSAGLCQSIPSVGNPLQLPPQRAGLEEWRRIAAEFRKGRPHAKGADFEGSLVRFGWPAKDEIEGNWDAWMLDVVRGMTGQRDAVSVYDMPRVPRLMYVLVYAADLDLTKVIDVGKVVSNGVSRCGFDRQDVLQQRVPSTPDFNLRDMEDVRSLQAWMMGLGPKALELFFPAFQAWKNDEYAAAMAMGVRDAIERWLVLAFGHWTYFHAGGPLLADATGLYFDLLQQHCSDSKQETAPALRRAWLWFASCTFLADRNAWTSLPNGVGESVLRTANEDVARLRKLLARAQPRPLRGEERERVLSLLAKTTETLPPLTQAEMCQGRGRLLPTDADGPPEEKQRVAWEEFEWEKDHLQTCLFLLYQLGGIWRGLKPMLLAWRALNTPGVARDLRYWAEPDRVPPPSPWCDLFAWPINLLHAFAGHEQRNDSELSHLRGELASFCLERLVDRWSAAEREQARKDGRARTNEDMLERSPEWRYCLIRAFAGLGVNPEGKGHRVLRVAAEVDPEPQVREAANHAFQQLRRDVRLPCGVSPRRAVMSALWWLRQAHLLGLGIRPDPDGAQRTRIKELARTKEEERADSPVGAE